LKPVKHQMNSSEEFDLLLVNGRIVDGTGNPWYRADVGLKGERIDSIGLLGSEDAKRRIDLDGLVLSPGFIDIHTHSDLTPFVAPEADSHVYQGVTTDVIGNCGGSQAPMSDYLKERQRPIAEEYGIEFDWNTFGEYLAKLESMKVSINLAAFVGQGTVRTAVMGMENRQPTRGELEEMKGHVAEAMEAGAFGVSTGLWYAPSGFAGTEEIIELARVVASYGGIYATHIRGEGDPLIEAVREAIEIGDRAGLPVQISHHKAMGMRNWGKVHETLRMMEEARGRGVEVTADVYAWTANATGLTAMLPHWVHERGRGAIIERLGDREARERIKEDMIEGIPGWESLVSECGWDRIMITRSPNHEDYEGRTVQELAEKGGVDPYDFAFDLLIECTGSPQGLLLATELVRPRGTIVLKTTTAENPQLPAARWVVDEITVVGSRCGRFEPALELIAQGTLKLRELISARMPLSEGVSAFQRAQDPTSLKVLIDVQ